MLKDYFDFSVPSALAKKLYEAKYKRKIVELVELIKSRWCNLKDEILKMPEYETEIEQPGKILKFVKEVFDFNKKKSKTTGFGVKNTNTKPIA